MNQDLALRVLGQIMAWNDEQARDEFRWLRLMARLKYDGYRDFQAGMRFIESLATWLQQFIQNTLANNPPGAYGLGLTGGSSGNLNSLRQIFQAYFGVGLGNFGWSIGQQTTFGTGATAGAGGAWYPTPQFAGLGFSGSPVSAGVGQASTLGRLSVPAGWPGATSAEIEEAQLVSSVRAGVAPTSNAMLNGVPMGSGNLAGAGRRSGGFVVRYGFRHAVMPRPPSAG